MESALEVSGQTTQMESAMEVPGQTAQMESAMEVSNQTDVKSEEKPQMIYRCKKCRRIVASQEQIVSHERGQGKESFKWKKRTGAEIGQPECTSIFVEPMKWMQPVEEGYVAQKLKCLGCNYRLGYFNWAGMQCNCGAWVVPAFQLHSSRLDEYRM
ncbi:dual specificity protein phosphatase-related protein [Artemisia annua]|uniref:Dual specificity protein phosphatase-related protein n=1 Tax=Artemisia annua TaxID=35608 RepID=A0A2U1PKS4_ARTAN|nr:dual specificity protein phosphatase-related protein [Artemisia annua]